MRSSECRTRTGQVLRADPRRRFSHNRRCFCDASTRGHELRQPEIKDFGVPVPGHKNVRRLDVAVNDTLSVRGIQPIGDFDCQRQHGFDI